MRLDLSYGEAGVDSLVRDGWAVAAAMMSAVLAIGIALAFLESQWGAISGRAGMLAQAFDKIAFLAACGLVVVAATLSTSMLQSALAAAMGGSGAGLVEAFRQVGTLIVDILIVVAAILVTLGILGGSLAGQFAVMLGRSGGVSDAMSRIVGAVVFGVGAALTIPIAHAIVDAVSRAAGSWF
jgi:hypothetical protein